MSFVPKGAWPIAGPIYSTAGGAAWKANWHVSLFLYRPVADHADSYMAIFNNTIVQ